MSKPDSRINWFEISVASALIEDHDGNVVGLHTPA
jgi:hypothetical protein